MDEERLFMEARAALEEQEEDNVAAETVVGSPAEPMAHDGGDDYYDDDDAYEEPYGNRMPLIIAGIVVVVILVIIGLFLPPISLGKRLAGEEVNNALVSTQEPQGPTESALTVPGEFELALNNDPGGVAVSRVDHESFLGNSAGAEWNAAVSAIPAGMNLSSNVYAVAYDDAAPQGRATIAVPSAAQPYQTLDLYSWTGSEWEFVASEVSSDGGQLVSIDTSVPQAYALMQTSAPAAAEVSAEILPTQSLPAAVTPYLTEVSAGTLTLGGQGVLLGDVVSVAPGAYRQLIRATNTGAVVDVVSLADFLNNAEQQDQQIAELVDRARAGGYAGVNIDYQGVPGNQKQHFTDFIVNLADALHNQGLVLAVTLETPAFTADGWDTAGQDWPFIGQAADVVYVQMPLDPAAYADNGLAEQLLVWATRQVARNKMQAFISVNAIDAVGDARRELANSQALASFGEINLVAGSTEVEPGASIEVALSGSTSPLEWDAASLTYKYTYDQAGQEHQVWLGSEAVLSHRSRLAARYYLRGIAIRGLGFADAGGDYAVAIQSYLGQAEAPQPASAAIVWAVEDESGGVVASSSGDALAYAWEAADEPGQYTIRAEFAQGNSVASLDSLAVAVQAPPTPTPEPEPTEAPVAEATPTTTTTSATIGPADPGDADAAANVPSNMRSGPGLGYGKIGGLQTGEKVSLNGRNADSSWLRVLNSEDLEGWVFASLLTVNGSINVSGLEVIEVAPPTIPGGGGDGGDGGGGGTTPPIIPPAGGGAFELGGQTQSFANPSLMQLSGMNWVKIQHKWGSSDSPENVAAAINNAHANGFKVLLSIPGANTYPSSIDFAGYINFLGGVAALGPDAIEIWNEMNIDFEWPAGQISPSSYVNDMLAPAYNAIKGANSNVMVVSGAPAPTGFDNGTNAWADDRYMAGVAAAGGGSYMDCIGVHHNAGATSPNATTGHPAGNNHYSWYFWPTLNMYYNTFGGARQVCFTELGYLSGQDFGGVPDRFSWAANTTVAQHAQWLAEAASLSANSGKVRMMIVFNVDFTFWGDDPQAGYAMLRPDGSCPSCDLLRQVMGG